MSLAVASRRPTSTSRAERIALRLLVGWLAGDLHQRPAPQSERQIAAFLGLPKSTVHEARAGAKRLMLRLARPEESEHEQADRTCRNARRRRRKPAVIDREDHERA